MNQSNIHQTQQGQSGAKPGFQLGDSPWASPSAPAQRDLSRDVWQDHPSHGLGDQPRDPSHWIRAQQAQQQQQQQAQARRSQSAAHAYEDSLSRLPTHWTQKQQSQQQQANAGAASSSDRSGSTMEGSMKLSDSDAAVSDAKQSTRGAAPLTRDGGWNPSDRAREPKQADSLLQADSGSDASSAREQAWTDDGGRHSPIEAPIGELALPGERSIAGGGQGRKAQASSKLPSRDLLDERL